MCARYTLHHSPAEIEVRFDAKVSRDGVVRGSYNVAPTQNIAVVVADSESNSRTVEAFRWGLVPSWADDIKIGARMINLRDDNVARNKSWHRLVSSQRCLIVADGFYEWFGPKGPGRQPYYFRLDDNRLYGFAGLWDTWLDPATKKKLVSCTMLTTAANSVVGAVHDRMPVMLLEGESENKWLDPALTDTAALIPLLRPYPDDLMLASPVSKKVNSVRNDEPLLIEPISLIEVRV